MPYVCITFIINGYSLNIISTFHRLDAWNSKFNYTSTFRLDSDFPVLYGHARLREIQEHRDYRKIMKTKTKLMAWMVSNCVTQSRRETLAEKLGTYIPIHVYGACGNYTCPRSKHLKCRRLLNSTYKFYFSAENSLCRDYVTEKFFDVLRYDIVPVVYGGANYSQYGISPEAYINVRDFKNPKDLADYLLYLDKNDTAYINHLKAARYYDIGGGSLKTNIDWCRFCKHMNDKTRSTNTIRNLRQWWEGEGCSHPPNYTFH